MQPKRELIEVRDENWKDETIIRVTPYKKIDDLSGSSWVELLSDHFTSKGERVNPLPDGSFQTVNIPHRRFWLRNA